MLKTWAYQMKNGPHLQSKKRGLKKAIETLRKEKPEKEYLEQRKWFKAFCFFLIDYHLDCAHNTRTSNPQYTVINLNTMMREYRCVMS